MYVFLCMGVCVVYGWVGLFVYWWSVGGGWMCVWCEYEWVAWCMCGRLDVWLGACMCGCIGVFVGGWVDGSVYGCIGWSVCGRKTGLTGCLHYVVRSWLAWLVSSSLRPWLFQSVVGCLQAESTVTCRGQKTH